MKAKKVAFLGLSIALALVLSFVESQIPVFTTIPGMKVGLPNLVTVFLLYRVGWKETALVSLLRAALAARFRAAQNSTLTRTAIRSAVLLVLQDYRARGWLSAFGALRVYADAGDASLCRVEFTYSIPAGLHRIALSAQMTG